MLIDLVNMILSEYGFVYLAIFQNHTFLFRDKMLYNNISHIIPIGIPESKNKLRSVQ